MRVNVNVDSAKLLLKARRGEKRFAYATVNAINNGAKRLQKLVVQQAERDMNIRKQFVKRQLAVIKPFASVGKQLAYAEIAIGEKEGLLLTELESSTPRTKRTPFTPGAKRVAVPIINNAPRSSFRGPVPAEMQFKRLGLKRPTTGRGKNKVQTEVWQGRGRVYMVPSVGVFERFGSGEKDSRPLYIFSEDVDIPKELKFMEIMDRDADDIVHEELEKEVIKEIQRGLD